ncbi:ubiquitin ligase activity-like protein [Thermochaetoides thermophila DSM 1495]|uniref:Ubiquitin ligase activity-like protein n=1 Tax=Chaetomium thermophilum (strain DSM 1495 / CBS 144.50 / IMI 039719) TaxID=759272 RepID=G0S608_CHATD|nr:ubiquitin ligase activity-like protein [Thermochaetoides thermophila DSM 1495]EGS20724.1 ubiquitin ligase activity-like protein [Thermochaetoides thermophila DSM 1495]
MSPPTFTTPADSLHPSHAEPTSSPPPSIPRRRQRVDSDPERNLDRDAAHPAPSSGPAFARPDPKRLRSDTYSSTPGSATPVTTSTTAMSAKVQGKRPDIIDLTGDSPTRQQPTFHNIHQRPGLQPQNGARKLVVKNLRQPSTSSGSSSVESYYKSVNAELDAALASIFAGRSPTQPMERLYRGVEDIAWLASPEMLGGLQEQYIDSRHSQQASPDLDSLLKAVVEKWRRWNRVVYVVRGIYSYLDRAYLGLLHGDGGKGRQGINEIAIQLFRRAVFGSSRKSLGDGVLHAICCLVNYMREGDERADRALLKDAIGMLRVCGVYGKSFEPMFLTKSNIYYEEFAESMSSTMSLKEYVASVASLMENEGARCDAFNFESTTKRQLLQLAQHTLVFKKSQKLLESESIAKLLQAGDVQSIKTLYALLKTSQLHKQLKGPWETYIETTGSAIVGDTERPDEMIVRLLELRRSLDLMIRDAFGRDEVFVYGLRNAFGHFINDTKHISAYRTSKVGEMIAKYIDMLLRGGLKTLPKSLLSDNKDKANAEMGGVAATGDEDAELDRQLDHAIELFRFVDGKDVFEAFYKKDLARRVLLGRSASKDAERSMLAKLKSECGSGFTHNLEQMFKDQELSKDEMKSYKEWLAASGRDTGGIDLNVNVLSAAAWPTFPDVRVLLPKEVLEQIKIFDDYYKSKHTGRRLTWKHNMAHCVLKARFDRGPKELLVSAAQAAVLMLFNEVENDPDNPEGVLTYEQISTSTGLTGGELDRTLQSLACGKARVLTKHPKGRDVSPTDTFTINKSFTDPKFRVKINQIQLKETKEENRETHQRVAADRQFETQAAIVRIMKSRKTMTHAQLVAEVIEQTRKRGAVDAADIKANIEKLIEKDYLEREGNSYVYLA